MRRNNDLENRLTEWGREYGGGRYEDNGWQGISPLYSMIKYRGRPPQGLNPRNTSDRTAADDVHEAVEALALQADGHRPAMVLRMEYMHPGKPFESKQQLLRKIGVSGGRSDYYKSLKIAQVHVAAWLHIPFCEMAEDQREAG